MIKVVMYVTFDDHETATMEEVKKEIKEAVNDYQIDVESIQVERTTQLELYPQTSSIDYTGEEVVWVDEDGNRTVLGKVSEKVTIDKDVYNELEERSDFLSCLEACGVDNWNGYSDARELMDEEEEE